MSAKLPDLTRVTSGAGLTVTVSLSESVTSGPVGGVAVAVAVLSTEPESTSAWVRV